MRGKMLIGNSAHEGIARSCRPKLSSIWQVKSYIASLRCGSELTEAAITLTVYEALHKVAPYPWKSQEALAERPTRRTTDDIVSLCFT
jgi:hypothetical protein